MKRGLGGLFAVVMVSFATVAEANPFVLPEGSSQLGFTFTTLTFDTLRDGNGNEAGIPSVDQDSYIVTFDHGLTEDLTLSLAMPYSETRRDLSPGDPGTFATNSGASDARIGLKWRLATSGETLVALLVAAKWPGDYEPDVINSPGDGSFDLEFGVSVGRQWSRTALSIDAGYRSRSGNPDDEIFLRGEASYLLTSQFQLFLATDWVDSQGGIGIDETTTVLWPFSLTEEDFTRVTLGGIYSFNARVSAFLGATETVEGTSTLKGTEYVAGISFFF